MGRENMEDYSQDFLIMLNAWEGGVKYYGGSGRHHGGDNGTPIEIALSITGGGRLPHAADVGTPIRIARELGRASQKEFVSR